MFEKFTKFEKLKKVNQGEQVQQVEKHEKTFPKSLDTMLNKFHCKKVEKLLKKSKSWNNGTSFGIQKLFENVVQKDFLNGQKRQFCNSENVKRQMGTQLNKGFEKKK